LIDIKLKPYKNINQAVLIGLKIPEEWEIRRVKDTVKKSEMGLHH